MAAYAHIGQFEQFYAYELQKQKMVDEKKGGWGKLAIDLRGAVEKEREQRDAKPARVSERRASTSYISDDMHNRLLVDDDEESGRDSTRPSFTKSHTISDRRSTRSSKRVVSPVSGGESESQMAKRLSSGLTKSRDIEAHTAGHLGKTSRARIMKELSFRNAGEVDASVNGPSLDAAMGGNERSPAAGGRTSHMKPPAILGLAAARLKRGAGKAASGSIRNASPTDSPKS